MYSNAHYYVERIACLMPSDKGGILVRKEHKEEVLHLFTELYPNHSVNISDCKVPGFCRFAPIVLERSNWESRYDGNVAYVIFTLGNIVNFDIRCKDFYGKDILKPMQLTVDLFLERYKMI
jgi:hypothetical protein